MIPLTFAECRGGTWDILYVIMFTFGYHAFLHYPVRIHPIHLNAERFEGKSVGVKQFDSNHFNPVPEINDPIAFTRCNPILFDYFHAVSEILCRFIHSPEGFKITLKENSKYPHTIVHEFEFSVFRVFIKFKLKHQYIMFMNNLWWRSRQVILKNSAVI